MPDRLLPGKYNPEEFQKLLLAKVAEDKWIPTLRAPYDPREIDPRKALVLDKVSNILGRLTVATHVNYEEVYKDKGVPLLKYDKGKGRLQYVVSKIDDPNYYFLVHLRGDTLGWRRRQLFCRMASFIVIPEAAIEVARQRFVEDSPSIYGPYLEAPGQGKDYPASITNAINATRLVFDEGGRLIELDYYFEGADFHKGPILLFHHFDLEKGSVRIGNAYGNALSVRGTELILNQDGWVRSNQGETVQKPLDEHLMSIVSQLPLDSN